MNSSQETHGENQHHSSQVVLAGKQIAFVGKLGGVNRRQAHRLVRDHGGFAANSPGDADIVVIGADELPLTEHEVLLTAPVRQAAASGRLTIITETELWQRLGLVDEEEHIRRLHTPAMLANLLNVSVSTIRAWRRRKWITPVREVHRLPYFDFQEVATARRLAELLAAGVSPASIEKKLNDLARFVPQASRPLTQLSVLVEGRSLLLRRGDSLVEPGGQRRFDFAAIEQCSALLDPPPETIEASRSSEQPFPLDGDAMIDEAVWLEERGKLPEAAALYRSVLAAEGPRADICFLLAELLYRLGDLGAARERYSIALEIEEDFIEARVNLGCLWAELGEPELAAAALEGALAQHSEYLDARYHLARILDDAGRYDEAAIHWQAFLDLAPDSPWAEEAIKRLEK